MLDLVRLREFAGEIKIDSPDELFIGGGAEYFSPSCDWSFLSISSIAFGLNFTAVVESHSLGMMSTLSSFLPYSLSFLLGDAGFLSSA